MSYFFRHILVSFVLLFSSITFSQVKVTGKITDQNKSPLPGVSILVKGTSKGVASDFDGKYSIDVKDGAMLEFHFIGFETVHKKISSDGKKTITVNIQMKEEASSLQEVVVVGFGTQKKENLTGSVSMVSSKVLESRPVSSAVQALQGAVPGMNFSVGNGGGELNSNLNFNIRGGGTIGQGSSASPLVLIDGVEGDLNAVNPQDIENISVLKDAASASIYGSRAAFGVILVTTKKGREGNTIINYNNSFRFSDPMNMPEYLDSENFAYYWNDAAKNKGEAPKFSAEILEKIKDYKAGKIKEETQWYPSANTWGAWTSSWANNDWNKIYYRRWAPSSEHNLSVRGGNEKTNYYLSLGWLNREGLQRFNTDTQDRYSVNAKISSQILPYLKVNYSTRFSRLEYQRSSYIADDNGLVTHNFTRTWPTVALYDKNGNYSFANKIAHLNNGKAIDENDILVQQLGFVFTPLKNWVTNIELNYQIENDHRHRHYLPIYDYLEDGTPVAGNMQIGSVGGAGQSKIHENTSKANFFNTNIYSSYEKQYKNHFFKGMIGFQSELRKSRSLYASRDLVYSPTILALNGTAGEDDNVSGDYQHWATAGLFGRLNYNYKNKYLFEFNTRYDGTSRFLRDQRWNVFNSASLGWNLAQEDFWKYLGGFGKQISEFKLKASYGELGNQNTNNWYPFYTKMKLATSNGNWLLNGRKTNTASAPDLVSEFLTWEKVSSWNAGIDLTAFKNRLNFSLEFFQRFTKNMVGPAPELPSALGTEPPRINNTDMVSKGFDFQISWRDKIGDDFSYGITANITDSRQFVTRYPNTTGNISEWYDGKESGEIWGYTTHGIAKTNDEMNEWLKNNDQKRLGSKWAAGDIMYSDLNGDHIVDNGKNTLNDHGDLRIIGNTTPRYNFGINIDLKYKEFDFSVFLQGTGKRDYVFNSGTNVFVGANRNIWQSSGYVQHLDYFRSSDTDSPLGANIDAYYPRPLFDDGAKNFITQTKWVHDASYLRVKNIQLGYTFKPEVMQKIGVNKLRIFVSAENILTFTKLTKLFDPEALGGSWGAGKIYPLSRVFSTGLSLTF